MAGRRMFAVLALSVCLATAARAAENADLEKAEKLIDDLRYPEAARALEAARAQPGNDRPTLLRILELQGIVAASTGKADAARSAFRLLAALEPGHTMKGKYSPKVMTPYYEAKGWVAEHGALRFEPVPAVVDHGQVERVMARVTSDPLKVAAGARFHVQEAPGGEFRVVDAPLEDGTARAAVKAETVRWWAELLGAKQEVLQLIGSEEKPVVDTAKPAPKLAGPTEVPAPQGTATAVAQAPAFKLTPRVFSYGAFGGAALALGFGTYFGIRSTADRATIANAQTDDAGRVTGLTQKDAVALDAQARGEAVTANVLFGVTAALAVTGGVLWWMGNEPPAVAIVPGPGGISIAGVIP